MHRRLQLRVPELFVAAGELVILDGHDEIIRVRAGMRPERDPRESTEVYVLGVGATGGRRVEVDEKVGPASSVGASKSAPAGCRRVPN